MVPDDPFMQQQADSPVSPTVVAPDDDHTANHPIPAAVSRLNHDNHTAPPGVRTPRRVQWSADHVISVPTEAEEGVAYNGVTGQEHESGLHAPDLAHVNRVLETYGGEDRHGARPSDLTEDYDYRLDPDAGDTVEEEIRAAGGNEAETIRNLLRPEGANNVAGYVQLGETDGLPSYNPEDSDTDAATRLVRHHSGKWSNLRQRVRSGSVVRKGRGLSFTGIRPKLEDGGGQNSQGEGSDSHLDNEKVLDSIREGDEATGAEAMVSANPPLNLSLRPPGMPQLPEGSSVLSSLLALYNNQHHTPDSAATSAATTPQPSRPPSPEKLSEDEPRHSPGSEIHSPVSPPPTTSSSYFGHKHRTKSASSLVQSVTRAVNDLRDDRPRAARSGAGVFGALVANAATMAAVAAPSSSTLVPAPTKPGYHLNRYKLQESPPLPSPPSRPTSGFPFGSRPSSLVGLNMQRERSQSPAPLARPDSRNSSGSPEGQSRAQSSDNLVEMKGRRRGRPSPLLLKPVKSTDKFLSREPTEDERRRREWEQEKKRRKKAKEARKKQEVYIIQHVAAILARQQFILKLARSLMMFGAPTHRLEMQIQATAKVLDITAQVVYLPNILLISFVDEATHTSETKFLKQSAGLDLGKLLATHNLYWEVVHDRMSVDDAAQELDRLMTMPPCYKAWQMIIIGGLCSSFIVIQSYYGSFIDALMVAPLGMLLQAVQIVAQRNDLFSGVFEIVIATLISFLAAVLASTHYFCFTSLVSGGIVLILPGFIVLSGALELASRNITSGAVRMGYSVIYSLFLGFGISIGSEIYVKIRNQPVTNATNNTCTATHYDGAPWYLSTPSSYWYFLTVPMFATALSLNNQQPIRGKELPIMVAFGCAGWVTNYFCGRAFPGRSDIVSAIGSFCVGILGHLYGRFTNGASFPVMVTGILMQLPSGLKEGGLFNFANDTQGGSLSQYSSGFRVASQLISVAVGLTVGLFVAAVVMHPLGGSRRRGAGIFSF